MLVPAIGAGLGIIETLSNNASGNKYKRFKEKGVEQAELQTSADRERILAQSPATNAKMKQMAIQDAGAQALQVAGNAGGSAAASGMAGGDVSSPALQGAKASQFTGQAGAQMGQAIANTYGEMANEQANQANQLQQNTMQKAQIADMVTYDNQGSGSIFAGMLGGALGGANALNSFLDLDRAGSQTTDVKKKNTVGAGVTSNYLGGR